jgi:hypothetical protein
VPQPLKESILKTSLILPGDQVRYGTSRGIPQDDSMHLPRHTDTNDCSFSLDRQRIHARIER